MTPVEENKYSVVASGRYFEITQEKENCTFSCGEEEFETFWKNYFDLDRNYEDYLCQINPNDRYLSEAGRFGYGIKILHQDLWEMIVSFLISQQNNIAREYESVFKIFGGRVWRKAVEFSRRSLLYVSDGRDISEN